jgi:2-oxoisovalerate dehydrogenase E1 component alpha subunit
MTLVAQFKIKYLQYIDQNGEVLQPLPQFAENSNHLITLYQDMVKTRLFDAKAVALQRTGKMGTFPSSLGQEAVFVGMGHAMNQEDIFCPYYRDQGTMLIRGVKMEELFAYWGGDERGSDFKGPCHDFPIAVPVASQCLHAVGCAYAVKYRKEKRAVLTTVGDGATSKGDFYEAMNVAGNWNLPVVFVINNNHWAISVPLSRQTNSQTLAQKAIAAGFDGIQVDGNDIIAVYDAVSKALSKAREGNGPTLIEAITYRLCDHTTADDAKRYVEPTCIDTAWREEPIKRLYTYLLQQHIWSKEQDEALAKAYSQEIEEAVQAYLNMPAQPATAIVDYHYETWPQNLQAQRDELGAIDHA